MSDKKQEIGRPLKKGIDYFPLNLDIEQDDKIAYLEAKYGLIAFALLIKLWIKIYRESYFITWNTKKEFLFAKCNNIDINVCNNLINDYINEDIVDRKLYEKYQILTSKGIQTRFFEIAKRREKVEIIPEFILIDISGYNNLVSVDINSIIVNNNSTKKDFMSTEIPKVKKSKVKESKNNIFSQIENLLILFSIDIKELILEYIECAKLENKNKQITDQKKFRLINELYSVYRVDENKDKFKQALQITVDKGLGSFPYFKKVRKNLEMRGVK